MNTFNIIIKWGKSETHRFSENLAWGRISRCNVLSKTILLFTDWLPPFMFSLLGRCFCPEHLTTELSSWWIKVLVKGPGLKLTNFLINSSEPKTLFSISAEQEKKSIYVPTELPLMLMLSCWFYCLPCSKTGTASIYVTLLSKLNQMYRLKRNWMTQQGKSFQSKMFEVKVCLLSQCKQNKKAYNNPGII